MGQTARPPPRTDLFARQGLESTSIKEIGAAAGVNPALLYYYFADKLALYQAVIERMVSNFPASLADIAQQAETPASGIAAIIRRQAELSAHRSAIDPREPPTTRRARHAVWSSRASWRDHRADARTGTGEPHRLGAPCGVEVNWFFIAGRSSR
ncbi:MAG: TetR/AcrR family transcriptional regulator [Gemmatimonadetes bacterium]|nr:TetR/AcrR family transcriptional regulator [Gemmatimonadota bacterium]